MTDTTQILLISVITVLTILLTVIGIQVVYILKEFRKSIEKVNKILDDAGIASNAMAKSIAGFSGISSGLKAVLSIFSSFRKDKEKDEDER